MVSRWEAEARTVPTRRAAAPPRRVATTARLRPMTSPLMARDMLVRAPTRARGSGGGRLLGLVFPVAGRRDGRAVAWRCLPLLFKIEKKIRRKTVTLVILLLFAEAAGVGTRNPHFRCDHPKATEHGVRTSERERVRLTVRYAVGDLIVTA